MQSYGQRSKLYTKEIIIIQNHLTTNCQEFHDNLTTHSTSIIHFQSSQPSMPPTSNLPSNLSSPSPS